MRRPKFAGIVNSIRIFAQTVSPHPPRLRSAPSPRGRLQDADDIRPHYGRLDVLTGERSSPLPGWDGFYVGPYNGRYNFTVGQGLAPAENEGFYISI